MNLTFLGAAGTVTGSRYLLRGGGRSILVDCGLFQGQKALRQRNWAPLGVRPADLDAVVLTHAHIDHSGYLPVLARQGFSGKIYCSPATRELCAILLPDAGHLQEEDARYANKRGFSKHKPALPLFTVEDARRALKQFAAVDFDRKESLGGDAVFRLMPAGHILGASIVCIERRDLRVVFSGDLGRAADPVMRAPTPIPSADYVVVESTYGSRRHPVEDAESTLARHLRRGLQRGGVVVVPAFAVGRAQTLLLFIARLKQRGEIPDVPTYLNSPMATNATRIYCDHRDEHRLEPEECEAACGVATVVNSPEDSRALNRRQGPMIIVSASGMATGGRVVHHLKAFAPDARNMILLPGFQAAGTRGAALAAGAESIRIHGDTVPVRAEVVTLAGLSAHADGDEILQWLRGLHQPPRAAFVTHGEPTAAEALRSRIDRELGWPCSVPALGDRVELA